MGERKESRHGPRELLEVKGQSRACLTSPHSFHRKAHSRSSLTWTGDDSIRKHGKVMHKVKELKRRSIGVVA